MYIDPIGGGGQSGAWFLQKSWWELRRGVKNRSTYHQNSENDNLAKSLCSSGKVGVAPATAVIRDSPSINVGTLIQTVAKRRSREAGVMQ